jgi:hypothetical protein
LLLVAVAVVQAVPELVMLVVLVVVLLAKMAIRHMMGKRRTEEEAVLRQLRVQMQVVILLTRLADRALCRAADQRSIVMAVLAVADIGADRAVVTANLTQWVAVAVVHHTTTLSWSAHRC